MAWWAWLLVSLGAALLIYAALILWLVALGRRADARALVTFIPDCVVLASRLAGDPRVPRRRKLLLLGLVGYLALPFDLVPDFIPVAGQLDDALVVALVLRSFIRSGGEPLLREHWPGPERSLALILRLARPNQTPTATQLRRRGLHLEYATLGWNVVGSVLVLAAAVVARSVALAGFGLDSLIEIVASLVVVWQLQDVAAVVRERRALRIIGVAFLLLAAYIAAQSSYVLVIAAHPHRSAVGIVWLALTAAAMFAFAAAKSRTGRALGNRVLQTEARVTVIDGLLALAVLTGLILNAWADLWWADPAAAFVIVYYGAREGWHTLREAHG
jgi:uncharacterized membrane protein YkvA (DUF1232 family)